MNYFQKETYDEKDSMIILQFASMAVVCELFNQKDL